jgi:hypothetical protein
MGDGQTYMNVVVRPEVALFGDQVAEALTRTVGADLVGAYFVGSARPGVHSLSP